MKSNIIPMGEAPETYHGVPVLVLRVGDQLPTVQFPHRYAVRVTPDLARYLLTFNHPNNRRLRDRKIKAMASDMGAGRWQFTPESLVFTMSGVLVNGQNRLMAVTETGMPVWLMLDFGWGDHIINVIDRATARNNADTLRIEGLPNVTTMSSIVSRVWQYELTVGSDRSWSGLPVPTSTETLERVFREQEIWEDSVHAGASLYRALDKGCSMSTWGAAYYIIAQQHPDRVEYFFQEIKDGTGDPGSSTRELGNWFRRRPETKTKTGDRREPMEVIIRAFNGWLVDKSFPFPKSIGFRLSRVKAA